MKNVNMHHNITCHYTDMFLVFKLLDLPLALKHSRWCGTAHGTLGVAHGIKLFVYHSIIYKYKIIKLICARRKIKGPPFFRAT